MIRILNRFKKSMLVIAVIAVAIGASAQDMNFYYPDGKPYKRKCKNILDINNDFDTYGRIRIEIPYCGDSVNQNCFITVGYKLFTDDALWVLSDDPKKVTDAAKTFNLDEYLHSWAFDNDLKNFIKKKSLTDIFILETLGPPSDRIKYVDADHETERWTYEDLDLSLTFRDGIVYSFIH